ncbi:unnamed protein product [Closterium sp. NIES-53]
MAYIRRCRELRDKLLRCGGSISEDAFVTVIIGGLGPQWHSTPAILRAHGKISEAALCAEIHAEQQDMDLQEERHKKKASVPEFAFHTQRCYNNNNYQHQPKPVPPFCHLCKTSGHPRRTNKSISNNSTLGSSRTNTGSSKTNTGRSRDNTGSSRDNIGSSRDNIGSSRNNGISNGNIDINRWSFNCIGSNQQHSTDSCAAA